MDLRGVDNALNEPDAEASPSEIESLLELEQEEFADVVALGAPDDTLNLSDFTFGSNDVLPDMESLANELSVEVSIGTHQCYLRYMRIYEEWLKSNNLIPQNTSAFSATNAANPDTPRWIIAWIMSLCDTRNPDGTSKPAAAYTRTLSHAMKIRSAVTYGYGRRPEVGSKPWEFCGGSWCGNPSVSVLVMRYMVALKRRKIRDGGSAAMSSKALSSTMIRMIYEYNSLAENSTILPYAATQASGPRKSWGGPRARLLVHAVVTIAFVCLLRVDEVLKLRFEDIVVNENGTLVINLPFRKNAQYGDVKPFFLWEFDEADEALCPVRALAKWLAVTQLSEGYLFRSLGSGDRAPSPSNRKHLTSSSFIEMFRNNLLDIGIDPTIFGGHSMRRGGCQWLAVERRWSIFQICDWGGWTKDLDHLTIIKYLFSLNDDPHHPRDQYFNPQRPAARLCHHCGRRCWCY